MRETAFGARRAALFLVPLLAPLLTAACATVRDARHAQDPASAVPGERTPTAAELGLPASGALRLPDAVHTALTVHPSVLRSRRDAEAAEARVTQAEADLLPRISANASLQHQDREDAGAALHGQHRFRSLGFQVSWLVFDFGATDARARQAASQWLAAQAEARSAEVDAAYGVRTAYFTLVRQIELRDVARDALRQYEEHLEQVREFVRVGTRIDVDVTRAEVDLAVARQDLVEGEDAVLQQQAELANAMGLAETTDWTPDTAPLDDQAPPTFERCWALARENRPSFAAARAREAAASGLVDARIAALYPSLSLAFNASNSGTQSPFPWSWQYGPGLSWVPFDGFQNLSSIDEAVAALRSARAARALDEQQAWLEVRSAWLGIEDARRRLELTSVSLRAAQQNADLVAARFGLGAGTAIDMTDARQALVKARADQVRAAADRDLATARLWKAMGVVDAAVEDAAASDPSGSNP